METPPVARTEGNGYLAGNIGLGGLMAGDSEGSVYYRSESDHWALYKAKLDGSEKLKLSDDRISNIILRATRNSGIDPLQKSHAILTL